MRVRLLLLLTFLLIPTGRASDSLREGFLHPPDSTKPWCYWYWISDNISREGITKDLEAMKQVGIGEAFIGNIYLDGIKKGEVKALTDEWWGMVRHAIREGGRLGVDIGMFNCPGWSQSGGPWIQSTQAMRYICMSERRVTGPGQFHEKLSIPKEPFQDLAVLAFPAPRDDGDTLAARKPRVSCVPAAESPERFCDGNSDTAIAFPPAGEAGRFTIDIEVAAPFLARSLVLLPGQTDFFTQCELSAADADGKFTALRTFPLDRSNNGVNVGFLPHGPVSISFPACSSRHFRLVFSDLRGKPSLAEVQLSGAARLERYVEKQLGKMHPTPLPMWDAYLWPATTEPETAGSVVPAGSVRDLSQNLSTDGTLLWDVPEGEWVVLRTGLTPTGTRNSPASPEGQGLEVDKMNRAAARAHYDAYIGKLVQSMPKRDRTAFKHVVADSYEMGSENWTDGFRELFHQRYGYDPQPWLPVLTGRLVASATQSDRFLWDLRRLVADRVAVDYVGGLREACHRDGLKLWLENYGHWGFPAEFLQYGGQSDELSGEFWATGDLGSIELRCAASAAHTYGKPIVHAEAFTSGLAFESTPWSLKRRGDWALTEGINHWVLHVYIHQPWADRLPGVNAWFSTEFNRHNTWFFPGREWLNYYRRSQYLLQQGRHVADVAYFIGEDTPKMTGIRKPALPPGYNFDYINAEVVEQRLDVKAGRWVLPDGMSYRVLVLPESQTMRPELLRKLRNLAKAGGVLLGSPPSASPSLQNYPACDESVKTLAAELWANCDGQLKTHATFGRGHVFRNIDLQRVMDNLRIAPDVTGIDPKQIPWTHRSDANADIYFISNQGEQVAVVTPVFRVERKLPELWDPAGGKIRETAVFEQVPGGIRVPLSLEPRGSVFVVFRKPSIGVNGVVEVKKDSETLLTTKPLANIRGRSENASATNSFAMTGWVWPAADIGLPKEAGSGVFLHVARNDAVWPPHGESLFSDAGHSCAGISAGRNGICVFEHSGNYFAPLLVHGAPLTNWTHVAVVYDHGTPLLYLNGRFVHRGLKSHYTVHPGIGIDQGGGAYAGQKSAFVEHHRALNEDEVARLAAAKPPGDADPLPMVILSRRGMGSLLAEVSSAGLYTIRLAGSQPAVSSEQYQGTSRTFKVDNVPEAVEVKSPWEVRFPAGRDVPIQVQLQQLESLTEHTNPAVKYFSGTVTYVSTFEVPAAQLAPARRLVLDLGRVEGLAEVSVNGNRAGTFWKPPFLVDISKLARAGSNPIEIQVTGTWRNRLIGQAKYPAGFDGSRTPEFQAYLTADLKLRPDTALTPFGLLGPVRLRSTQVLEVSSDTR